MRIVKFKPRKKQHIYSNKVSLNDRIEHFLLTTWSIIYLSAFFAFLVAIGLFAIIDWLIKPEWWGISVIWQIFVIGIAFIIVFIAFILRFGRHK